MDTQQQHLQMLRLHLLDMSKLSQRAVDYATKGYRLGSPEFCRYVRRGDSQLNKLRRSITDLCHKLTPTPTPNAQIRINQSFAPIETRLPLSALQISSALHAICIAAAEIAHHTMLLLEDVTWVPGCTALEKLCHLVNRLMCLCIVALFNKESHHAETVLQNQDIEQLYVNAFHDLRSNVSRQATIPTALEIAIANSLKQIARHTQEIAEAIVYWLEGRRCSLRSTALAH